MNDKDDSEILSDDSILLKRKEPKDKHLFTQKMTSFANELLSLDLKQQLPFWVPFLWYFFDYLIAMIQIAIPLLFILFYFSPRIITKALKSRKWFKKMEFHGTFDDSYFSWRGVQMRGTDVFLKDRKMLVRISEMKGLLPWPSLFTLLTQLTRWKSKNKVAKGLYVLNGFGKGIQAEYFLKRSKKIPPFPIFLQLFDMKYLCVGEGHIEALVVKLNRDANEKPPIFLEGRKLHVVNKPDDEDISVCWDNDYNFTKNIPHATVTGRELEIRTHTDTIKFDYAKGDFTWETIHGQFRRKPLEVRNLVVRGVTGNMDSQEKDKTRLPQENDMENWRIEGVNASEVDLILKPFWKRPEAKIHVVIDSCTSKEAFIVQRLPNAIIYHSDTYGSLDGKEFRIEEIRYCFSPTSEVVSPPTGIDAASELFDSDSDSETSFEKKNARLFLLPPLPSNFWSDKLSLPLFNMFPQAQFGFRVISTEEGSRYRWRVKGTIVREQGKPGKNIELKRVFIEKEIVENALVFGAETSELVSVLTDATKNLIYDGVKQNAEKARKMIDNQVQKFSEKVGPLLRNLTFFSSPDARSGSPEVSATSPEVLAFEKSIVDEKDAQ